MYKKWMQIMIIVHILGYVSWADSINEKRTRSDLQNSATAELLVERYEVSEKEYDALFETYPNSQSLQNFQNRAYVYIKQGKWEEAQNVIEQGIRQFPQDTILPKQLHFAKTEEDKEWDLTLILATGRYSYSDAEVEDQAGWESIDLSYTWNKSNTFRAKMAYTKITTQEDLLFPIDDLWSRQLSFAFKNYSLWTGYEMWLSLRYDESNMLAQKKAMGTYSGFESKMKRWNWGGSLGWTSTDSANTFQSALRLGWNNGWFDQGTYAIVDSYLQSSQGDLRNAFDFQLGYKANVWKISSTLAIGERAYLVSEQGFSIHNREEAHKMTLSGELSFNPWDELWITGFVHQSKFETARVQGFGSSLYWNW